MLEIWIALILFLIFIIIFYKKNIIVNINTQTPQTPQPYSTVKEVEIEKVDIEIPKIDLSAISITEIKNEKIK